MTFSIYFKKERIVDIPNTKSFLPFVFNPFAYSIGSIPSPWDADTFFVDANGVGNNPVADSDKFSIVEGSEVNQIVRVRVDYAYGEQAGMITKANAMTNPDSYLLAYYENYDATYCKAVLEKWVGGVKTELIRDWINTPYAGAGDPPETTQWLEVRISGTTVQLFQNNIQIGADQTVSNAEITGNTKCGMYLDGTASRILRFYCGKTGLRYCGAFGSSLTAAGNSHAVKTYNTLNEDYPWVYITQAESGHWPFSNFIRLDDELLAGTMPSIVFTDYRLVNEWDYPALEAITRKILTANPRAYIISPIFPGTDDPASNVVNAQTQKELDSITLGRHYGVFFVPLRDDIINRVTNGESLSTYMVDAIHLTNIGYQIGSDLEIAEINTQGMLYPSAGGGLPARLYDTNGYWEETAVQRINGEDNDGETGTGWAASGTNGRESSTAGDTITFNVNCIQFGAYSSGTPNTVCDVQIDGGAWITNIRVTHNGYYGGIIASGDHVITLRVRTGAPLRVDEFWAI